MINSQTTHTEHLTIADQTAWYSIGFTYDTNTTTGVPELAVLLDGVRLTYGTDYIVGVSGVQLTTQPEAGLNLVIRRDIPFTQEIDFQIGIIDPEQIEHGFDRSVMRDQELADYADWLEGEVHDIQDYIGTFGDVVTHDVSEFATASQGAKADTAVQPGDLSTVATTGSYNDLSNKPTLGTAAAADITDFATAAQGAKADTAVQPADLATVATTGSYNDLSNKPSLATVATTGSYNDLSNRPTIPTVGSGVITVTQGGTTKGTFNVNQSTSTTIALDNGGVSSVNGQTGAVVLSSSDVGALASTTKYGASLVLSMNSSTYVVTATLKDQDGNTLGSAQTIDLPLESVVVNGSYDSQTKEVVLTLESGSTIRFSVADLVSGLQTEITSLNMLDADLVDDTTSTHKFATASEKALIATAVQPADLATVATTGAYSDLSGTPTLGTAAAANATDFATAAQGSKADTAVQPADLATVATTGSYTDLSNTPTFVSSINSQTGAVTLTASDLGALPTAGGTMDDSATIGYSTKLSIKTSAGTNGFVFDQTTYGAFYPVNANGDLGTSSNGWRRLYAYWINCPGHPGSIIEVPTYAGIMAVGVSTLPQASSSLLGRIVHYVGADNGGTKSGYFYKCVSDGGNPATYSWTQVDVQPDRSISYVGGTGISISSNTISVTNRVLMNKADGSGSVNIDGSWGITANYAINIGASSRAGNDGTAIGYGAYTTSDYTTLVGSHTTGTATWGTAIGAYAGVGATGAIQLGSNGTTTGPTNSDANTFKVANANGNFELMSSDGTIPEARLADTTSAQQGDVLTLDANGNAVWQAGGGGASYTAGTGINITNGTISVTAPTLTNIANGSDSISIGGVATNQIYSLNIGVGSDAKSDTCTCIGWDATTDTNSSRSTCIGAQSYSAGTDNVAIGWGASTGGWPHNNHAIAIGNNANTKADYAIQLGATGSTTINSDANTFKVANSNGNFEIMSADGTIPEARLADTTSAAQGQVLTLDSNLNAVWQAGSGGLPTQTGNAGKFLTTDGTDASWAAISALVNETTGQNSLSILGSNRPSSTNMVAIGKYAGSNAASNTTLIGYSATSRSNYGIAIGSAAAVGLSANYAIQIGAATNSGANTFKVANENGNFEIMSADGTVPTDRFTTTPSADGTYVPTLTIASGVATRTWSAPASGTSSISVTLPAADWVNDEQTVTATGVTASNTVIVGAAPASASEYNTSGVICTAQGADSLTFSCSTTPSNDLTVTVLIM